MASKQAKKKFVMPKLPPDLIVTRYKARKQMKSTTAAPTTTTKDTTPPKKVIGKPLKRNNKKVDKKEVANKVLAEVTEYYPNKLKRGMTAKKIVLKPKHNMKLVAGTNKRKRGIPQRDISSMEYKFTSCPSNSELSMCEAVRLVDETQSLSDEDWMEILTCPSPVWWEDAPYPEDLEDPEFGQADGKSVEDSNSHTQVVTDSQPYTQTSDDTPPHTKTSEDSQPLTQTAKVSFVDFEQEISQFKIVTDKYSQKKAKLENILDNISKTNRESKRRCSESTEGEDIFSDLSLNEEDILQHLENIDIPMECSRSDENISRVDNNSYEIKLENSRNGDDDAGEASYNNSGCVPKSSHKQNIDLHVDKRMNKDNQSGLKCIRRMAVLKKANSLIKACKDKHNSVKGAARNSLLRSGNSISDPAVAQTDSSEDRNSKLTSVTIVSEDFAKHDYRQMPPLKRRPVMSGDIKTIDNIDNILDANKKLNSEEVSVGEVCTKINDINKTDSTTKKSDFTKKIINDLSECITVYRIMSNDVKNKHVNDKTDTAKSNDNTIGKLNDFFKKCKRNKRSKRERTVVEGDIKKNLNSDANNVDVQNRLNGCDYCVARIEQGAVSFSCETCNMSSVFSCDLCEPNAKDVIVKQDKCNRTVVMC